MNDAAQCAALDSADWLVFGECLASFGIYPVVNWLAWHRAREIPALWIDRQVPFYPWTVGIYVSLYPLLLGHALWLMRYPRWFRPMLAAVLRANLLAGGVFLVLPTRVARPATTQGRGSWLLQRLWVIDPPHNACPSLHTTYAVLVAWLHQRVHSPYRWGFTAWAAAIIASTLTTRQHRWIDVLGGMGLAAFVGKRLGSLCQFTKPMV